MGQLAGLGGAGRGQPHLGRAALHCHRAGVLPDRRCAVDADAHAAGTARAGHHRAGAVQPAVHHARHPDDVPVCHPGAGRGGHVPDSEDDRRPRPAVPAGGAMGYYCYLFGGLIILSSMALSIAPDSGWFMYTPLSSSTYSPGSGSDFWLLGITFVEISSVSGAIELLVAILRTRSNGMSLTRMPIFCWYIMVMALMIIVGFPPLILASILLELERAAGFVFFE